MHYEYSYYESIGHGNLYFQITLHDQFMCTGLVVTIEGMAYFYIQQLLYFNKIDDHQSIIEWIISIQQD